MRKMMPLDLLLFLVIHSVCLNAAPDKGRKFEVRDDKLVSQWDYAYPVGNGRLGAMPFGGYPDERILLNEETVWQGHGYEQNSMESMYIIEEISNLLWQGR